MMNRRVRGGRPGRGILIAAVVVAVILIIYFAMGLVYLQERNKQGELRAQIEELQRGLSAPRLDLTELRQEAARSLAFIPTQLKETDVYPFIRRVAERHSVKVLSQTASGMAVAKVQDASYDVMTFKLEATGNYEDVRRFITDLESQQELATLVVGRTSVQRGAVEGDSRVSLDYSIYVRRAAPTGAGG